MEANATAYRRIPLVADLAVLAGIVCASLAVAGSTLASRDPALLGTAILIDLTVTAGLCHWFLGVRAAKLPLWTVVPVIGTGWLLASVALPAGLEPPGAFPLVVAAVVEGLALVLAALRLRILVAAFRKARRRHASRFDAMEAGFRAVVPAVPWVATSIRLEMELWWFALSGWFRRPPTGKRVFTHHRETGWTAFAVTIAALSLVEVGVVHLILASHHWKLAIWIAAALHAYGLAWILGDMHAIRLRPTSLQEGEDGETLVVALGLRMHARIPLTAIASVECGKWERSAIEKDAGAARLLGPANVRLELQEPVPFRVMFLRPVGRRVVYLQVDEPERLRRALDRRRSTIRRPGSEPLAER